MAEQDIRFFNKLSTPEGEIAFGDVMKNNAKMAVMIRRIFPSSKKFAMSHSIGLQMTGALDGAIINNAPSVYSILCGEKPVGPDNGAVAGIWHAKNGDIIISAPSGRLRFLANDIDLIAKGDGTESGWVNIRYNATFSAKATNIEMTGDDGVGIESDKDIEFSNTGKIEVDTRSFKVIEGPDVSPITTPPGKGLGSMTITQQLKGFQKLIGSLL